MLGALFLASLADLARATQIEQKLYGQDPQVSFSSFYQPLLNCFKGKDSKVFGNV